MAWVVSGKRINADKLLTTDLKHPERLGCKPSMFLPHPDACRRDPKWRNVLMNQITVIKRFFKNKGL